MDTEILIVGAGPVGLMLAGQLQRRNLSCRLIETRPRREYWCKALGVTPRTLEIFDQMGVLDEAVNRGVFFQFINTVVNGENVARVEVPPDVYPYSPIGMGQYDTEEVLEHHLRWHGGQVEWGRTVTAISQDSDGVEATLDNGEKLRARYAVGCDGAHSLVRKAMGTSYEGAAYPQQFLLADVELGWDHAHDEVWKLIRMDGNEIQGYLVVVPIPGNPRRYRLSMATEMADPNAELPEVTLELLHQHADPFLPAGTQLSHLRWSSYYRISHRLAGDYRKGRLFIAGDAAHIHPPIGGLGMNTGLQDAYNLGWKLARGGEALLDTYHPERHRVGQDVVELTAGRMNDATAGKQRNEKAEEQANTQLWVNYRGGPLAFGAVPAGHRGAVPGDRLDFVDGLERRGLERRARAIDLMRDGRFHLFGYGGAWEALRGLAGALRERLGDDLQPWAVARPGEQPDMQEQVPVLTDALGQAGQAWGDTPGALLVRPDGHVAWRGPMSLDRELEKLLQILGART